MKGRVLQRLALILVGATILVGYHAATVGAALASGDGIVLYGEGTVTTPRYRLWTQSSGSWGSELSSPAVTATIRHVRVVSSPQTEEMIAGVFKETALGTNILYIQRWNGTSWSNEWNVDLGNAHPLLSYDIAYEQNTGRAIVVYGTGDATTNELAYRIWNGSSWTAATNYDAQRTSAFIRGVKLASRPETDEIGLAWVDNANDISANYWDGSSWTSEPSAAFTVNAARLGTLATTPTSNSFDIAVESASGEVLVAWGEQGQTTMRYATRTAGGAGSWSGVTISTDFGAAQGDIDLTSEPGSNYIAYAGMGSNRIGGSIWDGSSWSNAAVAVDTSVNDTVTNASKNTTTAWVQSGTQSRAVITYDDSAAAGVDWFYYNKNTNTWSAVQADYTGAPAPAGNNDRMHRMYQNPEYGNEAMLILQDGNGDLFAKKLVFDGTNLTWSSTEPGGVALEATISSTGGLAGDFAYYFDYGVLEADIVDGAGSSVASPSVAMGATSVSLDCQAITGTLGTASEKIRLTNTTPLPSWSLTVAATGGNTSLWSNGTTDYDFNDASGTPAGCADGGGDADSRAGQLTIDPSGGTLTPQSGCTTTGVSKGGSASFAQGTIDNITLLSASSSAPVNCYWELENVDLSQYIPGEQPTGNYTLNLTLTVVAN